MSHRAGRLAETCPLTLGDTPPSARPSRETGRAVPDLSDMSLETTVSNLSKPAPTKGPSYTIQASPSGKEERWIPYTPMWIGRC